MRHGRNRDAASATPRFQQLSCSELVTYLGGSGSILCGAPNLRAIIPLPMISFVLYVLRSRPSSGLSRRWYARSRCRGQGQGVRAGEPVRAPESRCSGAPLLTCKQITWKRWEHAVPPGAILVIFLRASTRRNTVLPLWLPVCHCLLREEMKALRA